MPERPDRVQVAVADEIVENPWHERDELLDRLDTVPGCEIVTQSFCAAGTNQTVDLDVEQQARLRAALDMWNDLMPAGVGRLHAALQDADPDDSLGDEMLYI